MQGLDRKECTMPEEGETAHRVAAYSDAVFAVIVTAMLVAFVAPRVGFALICVALILHLRPEASGSRR
jgi:uncharacterized membrane protein